MTTDDGYAALFAELKDALRPFRGERPAPSAGDVVRLREAAIAARTLIDKDRLRTRGDAFAHGALRKGARYLEERDLTNLTTAEELLRRPEWLARDLPESERNPRAR